LRIVAIAHHHRHALLPSRAADPIRAMLSTLRAARAPPRARGLAAQAPLLWKLAHGAFDPVVPMTSALSGIAPPTEVAPADVGATTVTSLPNGVRVASQDNGGAITAVGVYVGAGSRHETPYTAGATHLLEHCAFKGSKARSKYRMTRDVERTGAGFSAAASRETLAYAAECIRDKAADVMSILCETAVSPAVAVADEGALEYDTARAEVKVHVAAIKDELKDYSADPAGRVTEAVHAAAYHGNTLGEFWQGGVVVFFRSRIGYARGARVCGCVYSRLLRLSSSLAEEIGVGAAVFAALDAPARRR
jgi:Insulinase (Peptidase family M16)